MPGNGKSNCSPKTSNCSDSNMFFRDGDKTALQTLLIYNKSLIFYSICTDILFWPNLAMETFTFKDCPTDICWLFINNNTSQNKWKVLFYKKLVLANLDCHNLLGQLEYVGDNTMICHKNKQFIGRGRPINLPFDCFYCVAWNKIWGEFVLAWGKREKRKEKAKVIFIHFSSVLYSILRSFRVLLNTKYHMNIYICTQGKILREINKRNWGKWMKTLNNEYIKMKLTIIELSI